MMDKNYCNSYSSSCTLWSFSVQHGGEIKGFLACLVIIKKSKTPCRFCNKKAEFYRGILNTCTIQIVHIFFAFCLQWSNRNKYIVQSQDEAKISDKAMYLKDYKRN